MPKSPEETLRWPTNLDRAGIEQRLVQVRDAARAAGYTDIAKLLENLDRMSAAELGTSVVTALTLLQDKSGQAAIARQLEMVALNLKNLKSGTEP
jgi:hypothetical protein